MAPSINWTANVYYPASSATSSSSMSDLPMTHILDRPVFANAITLMLNWTSIQKSPYFELRGCDVEGEMK